MDSLRKIRGRSNRPHRTRSGGDSASVGSRSTTAMTVDSSVGGGMSSRSRSSKHHRKHRSRSRHSHDNNNTAEETTTAATTTATRSAPVTPTIAPTMNDNKNNGDTGVDSSSFRSISGSASVHSKSKRYESTFAPSSSTVTSAKSNESSRRSRSLFGRSRSRRRSSSIESTRSYSLGIRPVEDGTTTSVAPSVVVALDDSNDDDDDDHSMYKSKRQRIGELQAKNSALKLKLRQHKQEIRVLQKQVYDVQKAATFQTQTLELQLEEAQKKLEGTTTTKQLTEEQIDGRLKAIQALKEATQKQESRIRHLKGDLERRRYQNKHKSDRISDLEEKVSDLRASRTAAQQLADNYQQKNEELRQQLQEAQRHGDRLEAEQASWHRERTLWKAKQLELEKKVEQTRNFGLHLSKFKDVELSSEKLKNKQLMELKQQQSQKKQQLQTQILLQAQQQPLPQQQPLTDDMQLHLQERLARQIERSTQLELELAVKSQELTEVSTAKRLLESKQRRQFADKFQAIVKEKMDMEEEHKLYRKSSMSKFESLQIDNDGMNERLQWMLEETERLKEKLNKAQDSEVKAKKELQELKQNVETVQNKTLADHAEALSKKEAELKQARRTVEDLETKVTSLQNQLLQRQKETEQVKTELKQLKEAAAMSTTNNHKEFDKPSSNSAENNPAADTPIEEEKKKELRNQTEFLKMRDLFKAAMTTVEKLEKEKSNLVAKIKYLERQKPQPQSQPQSNHSTLSYDEVSVDGNESVISTTSTKTTTTTGRMLQERAIGKLLEDNKNLKKSLKESTLKIQNLQSEQEAFRMKVSVLEKEFAISEVKQQHDVYEQRATEFREKGGDPTMTQLRAKNVAIEGLEKMISDDKHLIAQLKDDLAQQNATYQEQVDKLKDEMERLRRENIRHYRELKQLEKEKQSHTNLEGIAEDLPTPVAVMNVTTLKEEDQNNVRDETISDFKRRLQSRDTKIQAIQRYNERMEAELATLRSELAEAKLVARTKEDMSATMTTTATTTTKGVCSAEVVSLQGSFRRIQSLLSQMTNNDHHFHDLETELKSLLSQTDALLGKLTKEVSMLHNDKVELERDLMRQLAASDGAKSRLDHATKELQFCRDEVEALSEEKMLLEEEFRGKLQAAEKSLQEKSDEVLKLREQNLANYDKHYLHKSSSGSSRHSHHRERDSNRRRAKRTSSSRKDKDKGKDKDKDDIINPEEIPTLSPPKNMLKSTLSEIAEEGSSVSSSNNVTRTRIQGDSSRRESEDSNDSAAHLLEQLMMVHPDNDNKLNHHDDTDEVSVPMDVNVNVSMDANVNMEQNVNLDGDEDTTSNHHTNNADVDADAYNSEMDVVDPMYDMDYDF